MTIFEKPYLIIIITGKISVSQEIQEEALLSHILAIYATYNMIKVGPIDLNQLIIKTFLYLSNPHFDSFQVRIVGCAL